MGYSKSFKIKKLRELYLRGIIIRQLSKEIGVSEKSIYRWKNEFKDRIFTKEEKRSPREWLTDEKFKAIIEAAGKEGIEYGEWLRKRGLKSSHIKKWRREINDMVSKKRPTHEKLREKIKKLIKQKEKLKKENKKLKKENDEKDALLNLKKKSKKSNIKKEEKQD